MKKWCEAEVQLPLIQSIKESAYNLECRIEASDCVNKLVDLLDASSRRIQMEGLQKNMKILFKNMHDIDTNLTGNMNTMRTQIFEEMGVQLNKFATLSPTS